MSISLLQEMYWCQWSKVWFGHNKIKTWGWLFFNIHCFPHHITKWLTVALCILCSQKNVQGLSSWDSLHQRGESFLKAAMFQLWAICHPNKCLHSAYEQCSCSPPLLWGCGNFSTWTDMESSIRTWECGEWMGRVNDRVYSLSPSLPS